MLWAINSGDLDAIMEGTRDQLDEMFKRALDEYNPERLGQIVQFRRLTGWSDDTLPEELDGQDLIEWTENILKKLNRWAIK